jgi:hypothetical protein
MYGATINELQVKVTSQNNNAGTILWSMKYQQGNQWHFASVDIAALNGLQVVRCTFKL